MPDRYVTDEQARAIWIDGYRAGRSDKYAGRLGLYEPCPYPRRRDEGREVARG